MTIIKTLPNGLTVLVNPMKGVNSAYVGVWVKTGSRSENEANNGIAHFLEHMAFKGTTNRPTPKEVARTVEFYGGALNAYTSFDATAYHARVLTENIGEALYHLSDIIQNSLYKESDIEAERKVILEEIKRSHDDPSSMAFNLIQKASFGTHPLGRPILGTPDTVSAMTRDDFVGFVDHHYSPDRMVVGVAGDVDPDAFAKVVGAYFGDMKSSVVDDPVSAEFIGGEERMIGTVEQTNVMIGLQGRSEGDPKFTTTELAINSFGGGMSSRLFQEIREKRGLCYSVGATPMAFSDSGVSYIYSGTSPDRVDELAFAAAELIADAAETITDDEITQARNKMKASYLMRTETPTGLLSETMDEYLSVGKVSDVETVVETIDGITLDDVKAELQRMCEGPVSLATYGPTITDVTVDNIKEKLGQG